MKFKIDENLPNDVASLLVSKAYNSETVYSEGIQGCSDSDLAAHCELE